MEYLKKTLEPGGKITSKPRYGVEARIEPRPHWGRPSAPHIVPTPPLPTLSNMESKVFTNEMRDFLFSGMKKKCTEY